MDNHQRLIQLERKLRFWKRCYCVKIDDYCYTIPTGLLGIGAFGACYAGATICCEVSLCNSYTIAIGSGSLGCICGSIVVAGIFHTCEHCHEYKKKQIDDITLEMLQIPAIVHMEL